MAQRTGAERFIASFAKSASARAALALALAALVLLCGCGGGSSDPQGASTAASVTTTGQGPAAASPAGGQSGGEAPRAGRKSSPESEAESAATGAIPGAGTSPSGQGAKHGKRIAQPKGAREQAPTPAQIAHATVADMTLESPAIVASGESPGAIPATYTCDGKDSWPQLHWGGVPPGTAELAVFVMNVQPVQEQLFVDWAVAGLDPGFEGIEAGRLPKGAVVGTNGFGKAGYSICPSGAGEIYMFAVYALPSRLSPPKGFDARELRGEVLGISGNVGLLPATYARG